MLFCKFCNKEYKSDKALIQHQIRCKLNPNKIDTSKSFGNGSRQAWNKGLSKETDERILKSSQTYNKNKELGLHDIKYGKNNSSSRPEVKQKISETCLKKSKDGTWHISLSKHMHYNYKGNDLHGTWEVAYAIYLDENNIKWIRNTKRFKYNYQGKIHYYIPDFYLIDTDEYIEIKGYSTDKDYNKWRDFPKDKKLTVLKYEDLLKLNIFNINIKKYLD